MSRIVYDTATSINGYIADEHNSLAWLFAVPTDAAHMARLAPPDSQREDVATGRPAKRRR